MRTLLLFLLLCSPAAATDWSAWGEPVAAPVKAVEKPAATVRTCTVGGKSVNLDRFIADYYQLGKNAGYHNPNGKQIALHLLEHGFQFDEIRSLTADEMTRLHIAHHAWQAGLRPRAAAAKATPAKSEGRYVQRWVCNGRRGCTWQWVMVRD